MGGRDLRPPTLARRGWGTPRSHSWCGTESAVGEGTLRCVISSVARNLAERFLGAIENAGPRNDTEILSCIKPGVARCIILSPGFAGELQHLAEPGSPVARLLRGGAFLLRACSSSIPPRMGSFSHFVLFFRAGARSSRAACCLAPDTTEVPSFATLLSR